MDGGDTPCLERGGRCIKHRQSNMAKLEVLGFVGLVPRWLGPLDSHLPTFCLDRGLLSPTTDGLSWETFILTK